MNGMSKEDEHARWLGILSSLRWFMLIPFGLGVGFILKHGTMLVHSDEYTAQLLVVDSVGVREIYRNQKTVYGIGYANSVYTQVEIDDSESTRRMFGDRFGVKNGNIPVWVRGDGTNTIIRYPWKESGFPYSRIVWKMLLNFIGLIVPAILAWLGHRWYWRKLNRLNIDR